MNISFYEESSELYALQIQVTEFVNLCDRVKINFSELNLKPIIFICLKYQNCFEAKCTHVYLFPFQTQ